MGWICFSYIILADRSTMDGAKKAIHSHVTVHFLGSPQSKFADDDAFAGN